MTSFPLHIGACLVCLCVCTQAANADPSDLRGDMQDLLGAFHETYGFPGATLAYVADDGGVETLAVGLADIEAGIPMTPDSRMLAASIGKTIWGALVLALEAEGTLSRADLVASHLGDLPWFSRVPNADTMTVGQLLNHTSGVPDHVHMDGVAPEFVALGDTGQFDPAVLVSFILDAPPLFEAGSEWAYTDTGYVLLGLVLEAATDRDVYDLAQDRLLGPLGLTATGPSDRPTIGSLAVGFTMEDNPFGLAVRTRDDGGALTWNPVVEWTGGGFASTSADLARWGHALFNGGALDAEYLDPLLDGVAVHPDAPGLFYGSGIAIYRDTPFGSVYGHGGWMPGYVSSLRHYADHNLTIAFQINTDVGIVDGRSDLVPALEAALAEALIGAMAD